MLELGAGCGLPGIVAARTADEVVQTDYVDQVCGWRGAGAGSMGWSPFEVPVFFK